MAEQTAGGWPYPLGSDPIAEGDNVARQLADTLDVRLGPLRVVAFDVTVPKGDTNMPIDVSSYGFVAMPWVALTPRTNNRTGGVAVACLASGGQSATQITISTVNAADGGPSKDSLPVHVLLVGRVL